MPLSCGVKCAKGVLITFNLIFWLSGCALIALGLFFVIEEGRSTLLSLVGGAAGTPYSRQQLLAFAVVGVGALVFAVGFCGCCGALHENKCMLVTYFIFLFLILAAELSIGVLAMIFQEKELPEVESKLRDTLKTKYGEEDAITQAIDFAQTKFECCGVRDAADYLDSRWRASAGADRGSVPTSCCVLRNAGNPDAHLRPTPVNETLCRQQGQLDERYTHRKGCKEKFQGFLKEGSMGFVLLGCVAAALEIFGMVFSICLCKEI